MTSIMPRPLYLLEREHLTHWVGTRAGVDDTASENTGLVKIMLTLKLMGLVLQIFRQTFEGLRKPYTSIKLTTTSHCSSVNLSLMEYAYLQEKNNSLMLT
jgi:hypothetical protein